MADYTYSGDFFDFVDASSGRSAAAFLARTVRGLPAQSVLDIGCGRGVWLAAWLGLGVRDVVGVDGAYVDQDKLKIPREAFRSQDISESFRLGRHFDLVQCLEVAEHVPAARADILVENITAHGDVILFSAARPGQGGEFHVNEQPPAYWIEKFRARGFAAFDFTRQQTRGAADIEPWYRYNALVFANPAGQARLPDFLLQTRVSGPIDDAVVPLSWRVRCGVLRMLPRPVVHGLAQIKHRLILARLQGQAG